MKTRKGPKMRMPPGPPQTFAVKEKESCEEQEHRHTPTGNNCRRYYQKVATRSDCLREGRKAKNRKWRRARQSKLLIQEPTTSSVPRRKTLQGPTRPNAAKLRRADEKRRRQYGMAKGQIQQAPTRKKQGAKAPH